MSDYNSNEYKEKLEKGIIAEKELEFLLYKFGYKPILNISYDKNKNITWQQIEINNKKFRNLDFDVFGNENNFIFKAESKYLPEKYQTYGKFKKLEKYKKKYLTIEKEKFDNYINLQREIEEDCYIFFLVGKIENNKLNDYQIYWGSLELIYDSIIDEGDAYYNGTICYIIDSIKLHRDLKNLADKYEKMLSEMDNHKQGES